MKITNVMIVEEKPELRKTLRDLINSHKGLNLCLEHETLSQVIQKNDHQVVELAIIDITLKNTDAFKYIEQMRLWNPSLAILVICRTNGVFCSGSEFIYPANEYSFREIYTRLVNAIDYIQTLIDNDFTGFTVFVQIEGGLPKRKTALVDRVNAN